MNIPAGVDPITYMQQYAVATSIAASAAAVALAPVAAAQQQLDSLARVQAQASAGTPGPMAPLSPVSPITAQVPADSNVWANAVAQSQQVAAQSMADARAAIESLLNDGKAGSPVKAFASHFAAATPQDIPMDIRQPSITATMPLVPGVQPMLQALAQQNASAPALLGGFAALRAAASLGLGPSAASQSRGDLSNAMENLLSSPHASIGKLRGPMTNVSSAMERFASILAHPNVALLQDKLRQAVLEATGTTGSSGTEARKPPVLIVGGGFQFPLDLDSVLSSDPKTLALILTQPGVIQEVRIRCVSRLAFFQLQVKLFAYFLLSTPLVFI
jgi:hypothetical protein